MVEYVGFDVSKEDARFCVMDKDGKVLAQGKADNPNTSRDTVACSLFQVFLDEPYL